MEKDAYAFEPLIAGFLLYIRLLNTNIVLDLDAKGNKTIKNKFVREKG